MLLGNPSPNLHLKPRQPLICFLSPQISLLSVEFYINMYSFFKFWFGAGAQMLSHVRLFATPWTVAYQAPLSTGILQVRILEWVAMPSSRGSSQPRD